MYLVSLGPVVNKVSHLIASDASCKLHVFLHDSDPVGMDCAKIGIFVEANKVCLRSLLEGKQSLRLESEIVVKTRTD